MVGGASKPSPGCAGWDRLTIACYGDGLIESMIKALARFCGMGPPYYSLLWGRLDRVYDQSPRQVLRDGTALLWLTSSHADCADDADHGMGWSTTGTL